MHENWCMFNVYVILIAGYSKLLTEAVCDAEAEICG